MVIFLPMKKILFALIFLCPFTLSALSPTDSLKKGTKEIHIGIGPSSYKGDLGENYQGSSAAFSIGLKFNNQKKLNGNVKLTIGTVSGQELDYTTTDPTGIIATPNTFFKGTFISVNYEAQYNLLNINHWKINLSQGIGLFRYDAKDENDDSLFEQPNTRPLGESRGNMTLNLPTQLGIKYYLNNDLALGIQLGFLNPITDNLDNLAAWGNKNGNDNIFITQFQLHFRL